MLVVGREELEGVGVWFTTGLVDDMDICSIWLTTWPIEEFATEPTIPSTCGPRLGLDNSYHDRGALGKIS